jgi:hypothetical protein
MQMRQNLRFKSPKGIGIIILSLAVLFVGCAIKQKNDGKQGRQSPWSPGEGSSTAFDFSKNCGLDANASDDAIVFSQNLKSQNFVVEAGLGGFKARVEAEATLAINSKANSGSQKIDVKVNKVADLSNNPTGMKTLITRIGARIVARSRGGTMTSSAVPFKEWLRLVDGGNPEFKGLLCAVTGEANSKKEEDKGKFFEFSPALVASINPKASSEQREKEIGNGRKFNIKGTLTNPISKKTITTTNGTVEIKPVNSQLKATDPLTKQSVNIQADSAYEVLSNFPTPNGEFDEFCYRITFYLSHKDKKFLAITQETLPKPGETEFKMPTIVMLPQ